VSSAAVRVARAAAAQSLTWDENDDGDKVISHPVLAIEGLFYFLLQNIDHDQIDH
jgi:hypothetical protein